MGINTEQSNGDLVGRSLERLAWAAAIGIAFAILGGLISAFVFPFGRFHDERHRLIQHLTSGAGATTAIIVALATAVVVIGANATGDRRLRQVLLVESAIIAVGSVVSIVAALWYLDGRTSAATATVTIGYDVAGTLLAVASLQALRASSGDPAAGDPPAGDPPAGPTPEEAP